MVRKYCVFEDERAGKGNGSLWSGLAGGEAGDSSSESGGSDSRKRHSIICTIVFSSVSGSWDVTEPFVELVRVEWVRRCFSLVMSFEREDAGRFRFLEAGSLIRMS